jgi:ABC-type polysaccharide/polyol phosphate transport system ATPase subunit
VSKLYQRVHEKPMLLREALVLLAGRTRREEDYWALRDVSIEVRRGETFGVVGPNGSGKSTLLQIVAGTTFPSQGTVSTRGRVSPLLALGAGFHPDMTGEENILVSASLMGLRVEEIRRRLPEIVAFAELEGVIDTPIRFYSSGMMGRLGFAVAINVSPNIVVIDEIFAVGDMAFQRKCYEAMAGLKARGATIVFASQSPMAVAEFCNRAVWLDSGKIRLAGTAREVASEYALAMEAR